MPTPERQILVCLNLRDASSPKGSCAARGAEGVFKELKSLVRDRGLGQRVMVNSASCLKHCSRGITVAVQPDNVWYAGVTSADLDEICREHLAAGRPVERLRMPDIPWE